MKKIYIVIGTRPEAIKLAPLAKYLIDTSHYEVLLVDTGQHTNLMDGILQIWNLDFDIKFDAPAGSGKRFLLPYLLENLNGLFSSGIADLVIVQGDTASATAGAIAAYSNGIPVAHVEAGLRSFNLSNPRPEEGYRRIIDSIATLHFAPSENALINLRDEGYGDSSYNVGNTVIDALKFVRELIGENSSLAASVKAEIGIPLEDNYVVFTQHRREGFGNGQDQVFKAISKISNLGYQVIFPVHPNPEVKTKSEEYFKNFPNVKLVKPLSYLSMAYLLSEASLLVTDSGGLQEEAPAFGIPTIITRLTTERPEVVELGWAFLAGYDSELIISIATDFLLKRKKLLTINMDNPYGKGDTSQSITEIIKKFF